MREMETFTKLQSIAGRNSKIDFRSIKYVRADGSIYHKINLI